MPQLKRITLDTNVLPADDLLRSVPEGTCEFAVISVTEDETAGTGIAISLRSLERVPELLGYGQGPYGAHAYGGVPDKECCKTALTIISNGALSDPFNHATLTDGERRQQRDAVIMCTHVRDQRDIFVTNDVRGFIRGGRREQLQAAFRTTIMTRDEFMAAFSTVQ